MKKTIIMFLLLVYTVFHVCADKDFVNFYNEAANWSSGTIGNGSLIINTRVSLNDDVKVPSYVSIIIKMHGEFITNGHFFIIGDSPDPTVQDPVVIYNNRIKAVLTVINTLIMDN